MSIKLLQTFHSSTNLHICSWVFVLTSLNKKFKKIMDIQQNLYLNLPVNSFISLNNPQLLPTVKRWRRRWITNARAFPPTSLPPTPPCASCAACSCAASRTAADRKTSRATSWDRAHTTQTSAATPTEYFSGLI